MYNPLSSVSVLKLFCRDIKCVVLKYILWLNNWSFCGKSLRKNDTGPYLSQVNIGLGNGWMPPSDNLLTAPMVPKIQYGIEQQNRKWKYYK